MASVSRKADASLPEPSSESRPYKYDVYLSFRGAVTRRGFISHLFHRLQKRGIATFMDDSGLQVGDAISPSIQTSIEESRLAIVVLSRHYAASPWCMDVLTKICQLMEDGRLIILPVFYHVDPSDVRRQKGSVGDAFSKYEMSGRHGSEKVQQWREALRKVGNLSGLYSKNYMDDMKLVNNIVEFVRSKAQPIEINTGDFEAFEATRRAMDEVFKALKDDEVTAVGVYGTGGVGKTTLVKHVGAQARKIDN